MYNGRRILALIPARGGSKGIKNKNIVDLSGYPLVSYSIRAAQGSKYVDDTVVSTDSEKIARISKEYGANVPFMRPAELATDHARTVDAVLHAIKLLDKTENHFDVVVILQCTQPLTTAADIDKAIETFFEKGMRGLVSVSRVEEHPLLMRSMDKDGNLTSLLGENSTCRRQDMKPYYRVDGCICINQTNEITSETSLNDNPVGFIMDVSHSVDIHDMKDLYLAEYYLHMKEI